MPCPIDSTSEPQEPPDTILPSSNIVSPIHWTLNHEIADGSLTEPPPPDCPAKHVYIPSSLRLDPMDTAHSSLGTGHPVTNQTLLLLQDWYSWPNQKACSGHVTSPRVPATYHLVNFSCCPFQTIHGHI